MSGNQKMGWAEAAVSEAKARFSLKNQDRLTSAIE